MTDVVTYVSKEVDVVRFNTPCPANVMKQMPMLYLLAALAVCCVCFWVECTFLQGRHFKLIESRVAALNGRLVWFVKDPSEIPEYWQSIKSWTLGQGTAYLTNLMFEGIIAPYSRFSTGMDLPPLDIYMAILIHDDAIGSLFRFGTWSFFFSKWKYLFSQEDAQILSQERRNFSIPYGDSFIDIGFAGFSSACWILQVAMSNSFAFTVSCVSQVVLGKFAPVNQMAVFFASIHFADCTRKVVYLTISIRFSLEVLHAIIGPYVIRVWGGGRSADTKEVVAAMGMLANLTDQDIAKAKADFIATGDCQSWQELAEGVVYSLDRSLFANKQPSSLQSDAEEWDTDVPSS